MKRTLIALALSAALVTPAMSRPYNDDVDARFHEPEDLLPHCTTFTPRDTLNARSLPGKNIGLIVGEFEHGTTVWMKDNKTVNGHRWVFVSGGPETNPVAGWVFAKYLTRCILE